MQTERIANSGNNGDEAVFKAEQYSSHVRHLIPGLNPEPSQEEIKAILARTRKKEAEVLEIVKRRPARGGRAG